MFTSKQTNLIKKTSATKSTAKSVTGSKTKNAFLNAGLQTAAVTTSGNGAKKYSTTGNAFIDQFSFLGSYKAPRPFAEIAKDMELIWGEDPKTSLLFTHYLRTITRKVTLFDGTKTQKPQKGGELKHEAIMRMIWIEQKKPAYFWDNIGLFVALGSWKDIFTMLQYDLVYNGWKGRVLNWEKFGKLILSGLNNSNTVNLVKKYLPQIKSNTVCKTVESQADTMIGKWICSLLFGVKEDARTYKRYRKLKTSGNAHEWQKLISQGKHQLIDFASIHGRALNLLVRSKYLKNQGLSEKYEAWVTKPETAVKYTGFVHELFQKLPYYLTELNKGEQETINKQFMTLVEKGKSEDETSSLIVVRDTSASMSSNATGTNMSCFDIGKALALYFSYFLTSAFQDSFIEFNDDAKMHTWKGSTPLAKWYNDRCSYVGSTEFQSVIRLLCFIKRKGVAESEFPKGILCISDSEFNPTQLGKTNVDDALDTLRDAGFSEEYVSNFVIVLWNLQSNHYGPTTGKKFETFGIDIPNVFYFSGYSAATVSFLTSKIKNVQELFDEAMNQEVLQMIKA